MPLSGLWIEIKSLFLSLQTAVAKTFPPHFRLLTVQEFYIVVDFSSVSSGAKSKAQKQLQNYIDLVVIGLSAGLFKSLLHCCLKHFIYKSTFI